MNKTITAQAQALPVAGIRLAATATQTRYKGRNDLTLIELATGATAHCVFTRNKFSAAPVTVARQHVALAAPRYLIINAGNANAGTGTPGLEAAVAICAAVAASAGCRTEEVLPFSTGVIGQPMNTSALTAAVPALVPALVADGWDTAAAAILTTDTRSKLRSARVGPYTVTGITKGSGMIKPDMATMLAYVATDAALAPAVLAQLAATVTEQSFNRITVDGDTSTNDALVLIATGGAGRSCIDDESHAEYSAVLDAIGAVCRALAQDIIRDGEGATKFITVTVSGGSTERDCLKVAYAVAESPLVKTALFASDANWGRILAAVGRAGVESMRIEDVGIAVGGYAIVEAGEPVAGYEEARAAEIMRQSEIEISIRIGPGLAKVDVWTCDLSYDYVRINGEYRS